MCEVELKNVSTVYEGERIPAIRNINLKIEKGEFVVIIGHNGAGKTTLLETINGLLEATKGEVYVFGRDIKENGAEIRKEIGYVPQEFFVDPLTPFLVKDVVLMSRIGKIGLFRNPSSEDYRCVEEALSFVGIEELKNKPIGKLSGGQIQKVMIARAIAQKPRLFLLDEPFSNLDHESREKMFEKIRMLNKKGVTVLLVTHNYNSMLEDKTFRIIKMREGEILC